VAVTAILTDVIPPPTRDQAFVTVEYTYIIPFAATLVWPLVGDDGKDNGISLVKCY
jgi:hypothetical protein